MYMKKQSQGHLYFRKCQNNFRGQTPPQIQEVFCFAFQAPLIPPFKKPYQIKLSMLKARIV